ncbi:phospholipase D-like domain-containing protein [Albibacterium indicum]|uniref:phospholipase D-like domain-containing protein n=1 Tax=Albibacterium indicum TaxID=2292082 RepID=UPI000E4872B6|nr:phospholipase D-like domain-containing protein [Pedobacter indicus]
MKLSDLTIESIKEFISGDNDLTPRLSGSDILKIFNLIGFKDVYKYQDGGMPRSLSRNAYVLEKLYEINGSKEMVQLLQIVFDPRHFTRDTSKDIKKAVEQINSLLQQDGYRLDEFEGKYKIIGADLPDNIEVEVHFEDIEAQIVEQIRNAKFSIWVAVAWFTNKVLMREIYNKKREGVNVRLIVLDDEINTKYGFPYEKYFETKRVPKSGKYENIMHHKFCVIDLKTVVHGSYNWTTKANWNRETASVENSRELAEKYASEFISLIK